MKEKLGNKPIHVISLTSNHCTCSKKMPLEKMQPCDSLLYLKLETKKYTNHYKSELTETMLPAIYFLKQVALLNILGSVQYIKNRLTRCKLSKLLKRSNFSSKLNEVYKGQVAIFQAANVNL